jgi:hypothetical protein
MYQERTASTIFTEQDGRDRLRDLEAQERDRQINQDAEKKNPPFVQLTRKRMPDLRKHNTVNPLAVNIFLFIAEHMGRDNILICSTSVLVEEMGKSRATVARAIKYLKDEKLLEAVKFGSCTGYAVSGEYVWTTMSLLETGVASAEDIDTACRDGFGHKMGPLQTADLAGLDVTLAAIGNIYEDTQDHKFAPPGLLQRMVAAGQHGRKTGRGFYQY